MADQVKAWVQAAKDDLQAADALASHESLTHIVSFHAQQAVEKVFKAVMEHHKMDVPKKHDLVLLHAKVSAWMTVDDLDKLDTLNDLYTESRYPGDLGLLPDGKPSADDAKAFVSFAKDLLAKAEKIVVPVVATPDTAQNPADKADQSS
jgi:HEPN domain-containing protein